MIKNNNIIIVIMKKNKNIVELWVLCDVNSARTYKTFSLNFW